MWLPSAMPTWWGQGAGKAFFMGIYFIRIPIKVPCLFEKNITCPTAVFNFSLGHLSINLNCFKEKHVVSNIFLQTWSLIKTSRYSLKKKLSWSSLLLLLVPQIPSQAKKTSFQRRARSGQQEMELPLKEFTKPSLCGLEQELHCTGTFDPKGIKSFTELTSNLPVYWVHYRNFLPLLEEFKQRVHSQNETEHGGALVFGLLRATFVGMLSAVINRRGHQHWLKP